MAGYDLTRKADSRSNPQHVFELALTLAYTFGGLLRESTLQIVFTLQQEAK